MLRLRITRRHYERGIEPWDNGQGLQGVGGGGKLMMSHAKRHPYEEISEGRASLLTVIFHIKQVAGF